MSKCKNPAQQKAILEYIAKLIQEFGAFEIDLKFLLKYVMGPQVGLL